MKNLIMLTMVLQSAHLFAQQPAESVPATTSSTTNDSSTTPMQQPLVLEKVSQFLSQYEQAFNQLDMAAIAQHTTEYFLNASPEGVRVMSREEFIRIAGPVKAMYEDIGQNSAKILSREITFISTEYSLVRIHWGVTTKKSSKMIEFDVSYVLFTTTDTPQVALFIMHRNEQEARRMMGVKK